MRKLEKELKISKNAKSIMFNINFRKQGNEDENSLLLVYAKIISFMRFISTAWNHFW